MCVYALLLRGRLCLAMVSPMPRVISFPTSFDARSHVDCCIDLIDTWVLTRAPSWKPTVIHHHDPLRAAAIVSSRPTTNQLISYMLANLISISEHIEMPLRIPLTVPRPRLESSITNYSPCLRQQSPDGTRQAILTTSNPLSHGST
jgi:hypothetical protein